MEHGRQRKKPRISGSVELRQLQSLIELSSDWYWEHDENYRFTLFTGASLGKAGIDPQNYLGTARWDQGAAPLSDGGNWAKHKVTLEAREPFTEFVYKRADPKGRVHYISASGEPVFDRRGKFKGYRGIAKDVTQRIQVELRLTIEHAVTRVLADSNSMAEAAQQILGTICANLGWACGAYWEFQERTQTLQCAETWADGLPGVDDFLERTKQLSLATHPAGLVRRCYTQGEPVWIGDVTEDATFLRGADAAKAGLHSAFAFPIKARGGVIGVMEFFSRSVHQPDAELLNCSIYLGSQIGQFCGRTQAEEQMREIGDRFQKLTELSSDWYWEQDEKFRFTRRAGGMPGTEALVLDDYIGKTRWELPYVDVTEQQWAEHKAVLAAHHPFHDLVLKRQLKDSGFRYVSISGQPIFDDSGNFKGYRGIGKDVTARFAAQQALRESEARFRSLTELSSDWYWEQDEHYRFTQMSGSVFDKTKLAPEHYVGLTRWDPSLGIELTEAEWDAHKAVLDAREPFHELTYKRVLRDGTESYYSVSGQPFYDEEGRFKVTAVSGATSPSASSPRSASSISPTTTA